MEKGGPAPRDADRRVGEAEFRVWPTDEPGSSSVRCAPRPYMRVPPSSSASRVASRAAANLEAASDWGSSHAQRTSAA